MKKIMPKGKIYEPGDYLYGKQPKENTPGDPGYQVKKAMKGKVAKTPKNIVENII